MSNSEPFYQMTGPDYKYVREDLMRKYSSNIDDSNGFTKNELNEIINRHIPETMTSFGSFRGDASFGIEKKLRNGIEEDIEHKKMTMCI